MYGCKSNTVCLSLDVYIAKYVGSCTIFSFFSIQSLLMQFKELRAIWGLPIINTIRIIGINEKQDINLFASVPP